MSAFQAIEDEALQDDTPLWIPVAHYATESSLKSVLFRALHAEARACVDFLLASALRREYGAVLVDYVCAFPVDVRREKAARLHEKALAQGALLCTKHLAPFTRDAVGKHDDVERCFVQYCGVNKEGAMRNAIEKRDPRKLDYLIKAGGDPRNRWPDLKWKRKTVYGDSMLTYAVRVSSAECVRVLLRARARVNETVGKPELGLLIFYELNPRRKNAHEFYSERPAKIRALLDHGARVGDLCGLEMLYIRYDTHASGG